MQGHACLQFYLFFFFFVQSIIIYSDKSGCKCSILSEYGSGAAADCAQPFSQWLLDFPELEMLLFFIPELVPIFFPVFVCLTIFQTPVNIWNTWNKTFCCAFRKKVSPCAWTGWLVSPTPCPCTAVCNHALFPPCCLGTTYSSLRFFQQFSLPLGGK